MSRALEGIRVVSMAEQYPGPLCTRILRDLGATVVMVERPDGGDPQRSANPFLFSTSAVDKKSVAVNLKQPEAQAAIRHLIVESDVFVEGFRPGVMKRLGLDYESLSDLHPRLVYCSISGYGQDGPYADHVGHNINYEAVSGMLDPFVNPGSTFKYFPSGPPLGDISAASIAAVGILAGLYRVRDGGPGSYFDVAISDSLILGLSPQITRALNGDHPWSAREAGYGLFPCADGSIALGIAYEDHFWAALCDEIGLSEYAGLSHEQRVEQAPQLRKAIAEILLGETVSEWVHRFGGRVPCSAVNSMSSVADDPQVRHRQLVHRAQLETGQEFSTIASLFSAGEGSATGQVPGLGEHTDSILTGLGFSSEDIRLMADARFPQQ